MGHEFFSNFSQNYRSVTFSDISIVNPAYMVDPNIMDETGNTLDLGFRGKTNIISYDISAFQMSYNNRIGFVQRTDQFGSVKSVRSNIGRARINGIESLIDFNLRNLIEDSYRFNFFINMAVINSKYTYSEENGVLGNKVEFVPLLNLKAGICFGYSRLISNLQFTYLSEQFTDATNAVESNLSGVIGIIPSYNIFDYNSKYIHDKFDLEFGVNNFLNKIYFTRRATGYPGPGIIPSQNRNFYLTLSVKL